MNALAAFLTPLPLIAVLRGITPKQAREYQEHHSQRNVWMTRLQRKPGPADVLVAAARAARKP